MIIILLALGMKMQAQLVQGELKVEYTSKIEISVKRNKAVNLYADLRENKQKYNLCYWNRPCFKCQ